MGRYGDSAARETAETARLWSPRVGATYTWNEGRSLVRSGWGLFYDKMNFGMVVDFDRNGITSDSFIAQFPADAIDPGPRAGRLPTNPLLVNGPVVDRDLLNQLYPPGQAIRNTGVVWLDRPGRYLPSIQQVSLGYQRQLGPRTSASAYVCPPGRSSSRAATTCPSKPVVFSQAYPS